MLHEKEPQINLINNIEDVPDLKTFIQFNNNLIHLNLSNTGINLQVSYNIIEVDAGFAYEPSAGLWYVIAMFVVMGYASYAPGTWTTADSLHTAWVYNFGIMTATWGITLLLWTQKVLFQSEGGIMHRLFVFWVNFSAIDLYLFYWLIDLIIFRATLSYAGSDKQEWWFKFAGLFAIQIFASYVQIVYRGSINFDYDIL